MNGVPHPNDAKRVLNQLVDLFGNIRCRIVTVMGLLYNPDALSGTENNVFYEAWVKRIAAKRHRSGDRDC